MLKTLILVLSSFLILSFTFTSHTYQTECFSVETDGYVTIKIWDTKKGQNYKSDQARKDAVNAILYSGIASGNACPKQPPILMKIDEQEKFKNMEKKFFANNGMWALFTKNANVENAQPSVLADSKWKVYIVSVSKNELRKYLESQNIIKAISNGF